MPASPLERLDETQRARVADWLPGCVAVADLSWNQVDTTVLHVRMRDREYIVKAAGPANHHLGRELHAHESALARLVDAGFAPRLVASDRSANVIVTGYAPGVLVEGTDAEHLPDTYEQAGRILRMLHDQSARLDHDAERAMDARALWWLDQVHRIGTDHGEQARGILSAHRPGAVTVVPTHGDWQPRNWLVHRDRVSAIDFGRFAHRPAQSDLGRLAVQQWAGRPDLEAAFLDGYGGDPRDDSWRYQLLRDAIGTAAWAFQVGDEPFEQQGHRMLRDALALF